MNDRTTDPRTVPPALAAAISRELAPVRPLLSAGQRTLIVGATAAAAGVALVAAHALPDAASVQTAAASVAVRLALGAALCFVALREGVPSDGVAARTRVTALALGTSGVMLLPLLESQAGAAFRREDSLCYWLVLLTAAPAAALVALLLGRAYPVRAVSAMALGSLGAAYLADVAASLVCADRNYAHAAVFHGGAVMTLATGGCLLGWLLQRRRAARRNFAL